ncbi:MAG: ParA family protein [Rickettsiaceae bacterium]|nr:ParA family protein [Rickettsiaceae bacterium]
MPKIISVAQQKGGVGKTTIVAHIAIALSQKGKKVAMVDIDPQGSLGYWHSLRQEKFGEGYTGVEFVNSSGWRVESAINHLKDDFDYIIIDSPPHTDTEAKSAIRVADLIIVPMQASPTDLWATKSTLDFAKSENKEARILLNRFSPLAKVGKEIIKKIDGKIFKTYLGNRVAFSSCFLNGTTVTESYPSSASAVEMRNLTQEILKTIENVAKRMEHLAGV